MWNARFSDPCYALKIVSKDANNNITKKNRDFPLALRFLLLLCLFFKGYIFKFSRSVLPDGLTNTFLIYGSGTGARFSARPLNQSRMLANGVRSDH